MNHRVAIDFVDRRLRIDDYLDAEGHIVIPDGATLVTALEDTIADVGDAPSYRYLDYGHDPDGAAVELTWNQLGTRVHAVAARLQQVSTPGDRVAILAPQGVDYVVGFFAAVVAGTIAVPLFAPELPGQAERLEAVLLDADPTVVLTTSASAGEVASVLRRRRHRPRVIAVDAVPESVAGMFVARPLATDDIAYLQYTSGSTRTPAGVEITHRCVLTNVLQMIMAVDLDWDSRSVSWLPLFHDMGLLMIMFGALCGGQITLMSPTAFVRRPYRWIRELAEQSRYGSTFAAAPNFAFDLAAERGLPGPGDTLDLSNVAGLINGSEPVSIGAINRFTEAFAPYGLSPTTIKPSYGMAEATLLVSTIGRDAAPKALYLDRERLGDGYAVPMPADAPDTVPAVSCGPVAPSLWAAIVDTDTDAELPDGRVGEVWLHGDNVGRGYWGRTAETELTFVNKLQSRLPRDSHAEGSAVGGTWLRTGDLGMYLDDELYIVGRIKDLVIVDGRNHYPSDIEATVAQASPAVRADHVCAFAVPGSTGEQLVVVAERAIGAGKADPGGVVGAVRAAVSSRHGVPLGDFRLVAAGRIPRTTSGKLARSACRQRYLADEF